MEEEKEQEEEEEEEEEGQCEEQLECGCYAEAGNSVTVSKSPIFHAPS